MFFFPHVLGTLLAVASPSPSPAPSAPPDIAHVYTSDRTDETLNNAARTTYVVTREQILRNGYRTVAQALQAIPALEISPLGAFGSSVSYGIRGSSSPQVLVLVDGLPAPGSFSNTVELGNLPTTGVDRIEVVEGGGSTLYGTGAIGGIINIITQRTAQNGAALRYGSFGGKEVAVDTPHVQFYRAVASNDFGLPDGTVRPDSDYRTTALHANAGHRVGAFDAVVRVGLESDHLGAPGPDSFLSPTSREDDVNKNANLTLTHTSSQSQATMQFGATDQVVQFACDAVTDANCFFSYPALDTESRVDFNARNVVAAKNSQLQYGIDLSRGTVRSDAGSTAFLAPGASPIDTHALAQSAAYAQNRWSAKWGSAYAGMRAERDGSLGGEFSPSAGFIVHLSGDASLKGNVATAFRAPNASELYFPGFGVPTLQPERAKVADLSIVDSHLLGGATLGWFTNRTNDLIQYNLSTFTLDQITHAFIQGFTFELRTPTYRGITASLNATDLYRAENVDTGARLANDPVFATNLRLDYAAGNSPSIVDSLGVAVRLAGDRGLVDHTAPLFDQPVAYTNVDAYVRLRASRDLLVSLRGLNLGNERYAATAGYPMPGRSFMLELSTK